MNIVEKHQLLKKVSTFILAGGILVTSLSPMAAFAAGEGSNKIEPTALISLSDYRKNNEFNLDLDIHKLSFKGEKPSIQNTFGELSEDDLGDAIPWDPTQLGEVEFTIRAISYDDVKDLVDESQKEALDKSKATNGYYALGNDDVQNLLTIAKENTDIGTTVGPVKVGTDGIASFKGMTVTPEVIGYFVEETKSPSTTVSTKAEDMFIPAFRTYANNNFIKHMKVYPKNETKDIELSIVKDKKGTETGIKTKLNKAQFTVYKGEPGSGEPYMVTNEDGEETPLIMTTDAEGKAVVRNLPIGKYYLVENPVDGVSFSDATGKEFNDMKTLAYIDPRVENKDTNVLEYVIADSTEDSVLNQTLTNYEPPTEPNKSILDEKKQYPNNTIPFDIRFKVPDNIEKYESFVLTDRSTPNLTIDQDTIEVKLVTKANEGGEETEDVLVKDEDFTINYEEDQPNLDVNGKDITGNKLTVTLNSEFTKDMGGAEDSTREFILTYKSKLDADTLPTDSIENTVSWTGDNGSEGKEIPSPPDTETFKVYGAKFQKTDDGAFGTGLLEAGLQDAKFVLRQKQDDGNFKYVKAIKTPNDDYGLQYVDESITDLNAVVENIEAFDEGEANANGNKGIFVSGEKGVFEITGLPVGEYELVEYMAPEGYQLINEPISFEVTQTSYDDMVNNPDKIVNKANPDLPMTGSEKIIIFVGAGIIALSTGAVVSQKKKAKQQ